MFVVSRARSARSLLLGVSAAVAIPLLAWPTVAAADDEVATGATVVGELVQLWPEYEDAEEATDHAEEGPLSFVRTDEGGSVRVDTGDVRDIEVGATVELTVGRATEDTASKELGYDEAREVVGSEVLAAAAPPTAASATAPFTNSVTVAMVVPAGGTRDGAVLREVVDAVDGPVADFWESQTDGAVTLGVTDAHDWITTTSTCEDPFVLWEEVADRVGFVEGPGKHLLLYVTSGPHGLAGCSYGLAEVGSAPSAGGFAYVRAAATSVIAHELGHNFGLRHSSALHCDARVNSGGCDTFPYHDLYDVMGFSWQHLGSLNVVQASRLGPVEVRTLGLDGPAQTITIAPLSQRTGVRAAVLKTSDPFADYWLEFRPAAGQDAWLGTGGNVLGLQSGVLLRKNTGGTHGSDSSLLLDGTPSRSSGWASDFHAALPMDMPVRVEDDYRGNGAFTVTVTDVSPDGATVQVVPGTAIDLAHEALGGDAGPYGPPTTAETCGLPRDGCKREYANGHIYFSPATGAHGVTGDLLNGWLTGGGISGALGYPAENAVCGLVRGGCGQRFSGGWLYWSPATGPHDVRGAVAQAWMANGGVTGPLGYPLGYDKEVAGGSAVVFEGGAVYWSSGTGARVLRGGVLTAFRAAGGPNGWLGYPTGDSTAVPGGHAAPFQGGSVYESAATGGHAVRSAVLPAWWATGGVTGPLGFPTAGTAAVAGGTVTSFAGGSVYSSPATGVRVVAGALRDAFTASGGVTGTLGFPTTGVLSVPGGTAVAFQGGSIYDSPGSGAHVVRGAVRTAWWASGGVTGPLGFPTSDYAALPGGFAAAFQGGSVYESAATGARIVRGDLRSAWWASGGATGPLGFPASDALAVPGGTAQAFTGGSVYASPATGAHALPTPMLAPWWATGGVTGPFGFPVSGLLPVPGGSAVAFSGGSVYESAATGAHPVSGALRSGWWASGGVTGPLGFPTSGALAVPGGTAQAFAGGSVYSSPAGGTRAVRTEFLTPWWAAGGVGGPMGFPVSDLLDVPGGTAQAFAGGSVYAATGSPAYAVRGATRDAWWAAGGLSGWLGFPVENTTITGSRSSTRFAGGLLATSPTGTLGVLGPYMQAIDRVGGAAAVGLPVAAETPVPGGRAQAFDRASVYWSSSTGARVVSGPLRTAWWASGGVTGPYGFPTGDVVDVGPGEQSLAFATGTLHWSSTTGTRFVAG